MDAASGRGADYELVLTSGESNGCLMRSTLLSGGYDVNNGNKQEVAHFCTRIRQVACDAVMAFKSQREYALATLMAGTKSYVRVESGLARYLQELRGPQACAAEVIQALADSLGIVLRVISPCNPTAGNGGRNYAARLYMPYKQEVGERADQIGASAIGPHRVSTVVLQDNHYIALVHLLDKHTHAN